MCMTIETDMTNSEIKEAIQYAVAIYNKNKKKFHISISGYDDDQRELYEIPEVVDFCKRLCDIGFIAIAQVSTTCSDLLENDYEENFGLGALEIWMFANDLMGDSISQQNLDLFFKCLKEACQKATVISEEPPYKTGMGKFEVTF